MIKKERTLLYGANLWYFGEGMLGPLFAVFAEKVGGNVLDITWAWAIYLLTTGLLIILVGRISDAGYKKEKLLVAGYILNAFFTFSYLLVSSPLGLFLVQAGLGAALALATPTWDALYARYEDKKHDGFTWGLAKGEASMVTAIAIILGGFTVHYFSFNLLFLIMGTIQIIAAVYITQIVWKARRLPNA